MRAKREASFVARRMKRKDFPISALIFPFLFCFLFYLGSLPFDTSTLQVLRIVSATVAVFIFFLFLKKNMHYTK